MNPLTATKAAKEAKLELIITTPEALEALVRTSVEEVIVRREREERIAATLADEDAMHAEIAAAETGLTDGKHSMIAGWMVSRMDQHIRPAHPIFQCQREDPPEHVVAIVEEARRHLQVDLSGFETDQTSQAVAP